MLTLGTGIGTSLFVGGRLVPNTELGHIEIRGEDAEHRAADGARKREDLNWKQYAGRLDEYLHKIETSSGPT
jgi:polyphosphate glucokinase